MCRRKKGAAWLLIAMGIALAAGSAYAGTCANFLCAPGPGPGQSQLTTKLNTNCVSCEPPEGYQCCDMVTVPAGCSGACVPNGSVQSGFMATGCAGGGGGSCVVQMWTCYCVSGGSCNCYISSTQTVPNCTSTSTWLCP